MKRRVKEYGQWLVRRGQAASWSILIAGCAWALAGCSKQQTLRALFAKGSPHQQYGSQLQQAGLHRQVAGRAWLAAADQALRDSLVVALPFAETGYFRPEQPAAASYRYSVRAGDQVHVVLELAPGARPRVFVDAFAVMAGHARQPLASADTLGLDFRYRAEADGQHLLRVQPELLATGRYTLRVRREPSLGVFPVQGQNGRAAGSYWGALRDGGARRHEGIDIFAPRGTPALAAANGLVSRTGETALGGRVVWLTAAHGEHLYYAHLDKQLVTAGQLVRAGDTLGLVGNTGNAHTTTPHLHFGVYRSGEGAVDPWPYVRAADQEAARPAGPEQRGRYVRCRVATKLLARPPAAPSRKQAAVTDLSGHLPLLVLGRQDDVLRVLTPSGLEGYVPAAAVVEAGKAPLHRLVLPAAAELKGYPAAAAPAFAAFPANTPVLVLGQHNGFSLVRGQRGRTGWVVL